MRFSKQPCVTGHCSGRRIPEHVRPSSDTGSAGWMLQDGACTHMPRDRLLETLLHVGDQPNQNWQPVLGVSSPMSLEQRPAGTGGAIEITVPTAGFDLCRGPPVKGGWTPWVTDREAELSFLLMTKLSILIPFLTQYPRVAKHGDLGC